MSGKGKKDFKNKLLAYIDVEREFDLEQDENDKIRYRREYLGLMMELKNIDLQDEDTQVDTEAEPNAHLLPRQREFQSDIAAFLAQQLESWFVTKDTSFESADKSVVNTDHVVTSLTKLSRLLDIIHYVNRNEKDFVNNERNDGVCAIMAENDKVLSCLHMYMITRFTSFIRLYFYIHV